MMTFVQATYVLATFVHIINIAAVIDPMLTKLFGPNILGALIFVTNFFLNKMPLAQIVFGPSLFYHLNFLEPWRP